jgi:uncharacterized protein (TIGR02594 family)
MAEIDREIEIEKLKADLEKSKTINRYQLVTTFLGTFLVSVIGSYLLFVQNTEKNLQDFDGGHREFVSKFVEIAIDEDIERRQRLARYFASVTLDVSQKARWEEYANYIDALIEKNPKQIAALQKDLDTASGAERSELKAKIRLLENQLSPSSERANIQLQSSKGCIDQFEKYPERWRCIALKELNFGVKEVPGADTNPRIRDYAEYAAPDSPFVNEGDDIPWAGLFVAWVVVQSGIDKANLPKNSYANRSWLGFGKETSIPEPGVIAVFWRQNQNSQLSTVGFYDGEDDKVIYIIAGNIQDAVSRSGIPKEKLLGYRRF